MHVYWLLDQKVKNHPYILTYLLLGRAGVDNDIHILVKQNHQSLPGNYLLIFLVWMARCAWSRRHSSHESSRRFRKCLVCFSRREHCGNVSWFLGRLSSSADGGSSVGACWCHSRANTKDRKSCTKWIM